MRCRGNDDRFILTVLDCGPGIPLVLRNRISNVFARPKHGPLSEFGRAGLALSIAKDFVQLHGHHDLGRARWGNSDPGRDTIACSARIDGARDR
jgi:signal transduction histidine kinase